jgi:O-antigen ligase
MADQIAESGERKQGLRQLGGFFRDRIQLNSVLLVLCFVSVLLLESQSAASYSTYFLSLAMLVTFREWNDVFHERMLWVITGLLAWLVLSALWSRPFEARDLATVFTRALLVFFFVVAFAECQLRGQLRRWLGRALAIVGLLAVVLAMWVHYEEPPIHGRLNGLGQLDTQVVAALVYGVVLIFVLDVVVTDQSAGWRGLAAFSAFVVAYAVYLSDSRNAWVSVLLGAGIFGLAHVVNNRERFVVAVGALAVVLLAAIAALIASETTEAFILPRGSSFRPEIWRAALERITDGNKWLGLGINTPDDFRIFGRTFLHPHNMYLSVAYQGGLIALGLLLVLLGWVIRALMRNYSSPDAKFALGVLSIAVSAYLLDGHELIDKIGATWLMFWLPVAIALGFNWSQPSRAL